VTHEALAAFDRAGQMIAIARYATARPEDCSADIAVTVADAWQGRGIGPALTAQVVDRARDNAFASLTATTLESNAPALSLLARLGFRRCGSSAGVLDFQLALTGAPC
jgi:acetyltransferase